MNNSIKRISFFIGDLVRITRDTLRIEKSLYNKKMELTKFAGKKLNEMVSLILRKQDFTYKYTITVEGFGGMIHVDISWEDQEFDGYSTYYNVHDFDSHFEEVLDSLAYHINLEYDRLICVV